MNKTSTILLTAMLATGAMFLMHPAHAGQVTSSFMVPETSVAHPGDRGVRMHTNYVISTHVRPNIAVDAVTGFVQPASIPYGVTPAQLHAIYNVPAGGANAIAIVDAYHYPTSLADFNYYASAAGLPQETSTIATASTNKVFQVVYAGGSQPAQNSGWNTEEALDIEAAHGMAPNAKIYLVEAASSSVNALFQAVRQAATLPGVKQISMSWGCGEFSSEIYYDSMFNAYGVVYLASSGDSGAGVGYPAAAKTVVGVGGTTLNFSNGTFTSETGWSGSGGGISSYESRPGYQSKVSTVVSYYRGVPDISADADPYSGIAVYQAGQWMQVGGTSLASPLVAGMINVAQSNAGSSYAELLKVYFYLGSQNQRDIISGSNGYSCKPGYDLVTGVGSPNGTGAL